MSGGGVGGGRHLNGGGGGTRERVGDTRVIVNDERQGEGGLQELGGGR